jgi:hypothetical protein
MIDPATSPLILSPLVIATLYPPSTILSSCLKDEAIGGERAPTGIHVHDIAIVLSRF